MKLLIPVGTTASMAVKRQAPTTPILFISVGNPLGIGLVKNLGHPGLNVTGFSDNLAELSSKYVQFATELGSPSVVHYLWYPGWTDGQYRLQAAEQAAQSLKVKLRTYALNDIAEAPQPPRRFLPGENPSRHATRRSSGRAADEVRAPGQPKDGEGGRPHR